MKDEWDYTVPRIPAPASLDNFSLRDLVGAIQAGETCEAVRAYLARYNEALGPERLKTKIDAELDDMPAIFYVVETGNAEMVKVWARYGADLDRRHGRIPLLGFAIVHCRSFRKDMPMVVKTLLSLGTSVDVIPGAFYDSLHRDIPEDGPPDEELGDLQEESKKWCVPAARRRIAHALNFSFTVRYVLHLASRDEPLSGANKKLARVHKSSELLGLRYFLVGQTLASGLLIERFLT